ncbi:6,7-dimethyl-8-ribityllumazine synthase [Mitsuaria sp. GD03876]|uniref:6,7-dimethyl-8-ribityllumazine synthase n=1 Tax=Mitsuaria sp. GD03876 TaxID=2975399 RepID=UPI00244B0E57|nr:6,7-dimethyl-8-ribityllumazine synthase [Mitsuaria sp. GD03876]MDH0867443.1 6,7-dimethyl-8-ribityllumazine synthase [Mitsuaria sp. GD03876]
MNQTNLHAPAIAGSSANSPAESPSKPPAKPPAKRTTPRVAIVSASWHADLVGRCREAAIRGLESTGPVQVDTFDVPGAFEIPLHAMKLARSGQFDAVLACALVVDGGIYRHDFVAHAVIDGLMRVQLDTGVPVFSAVLTPLAFHEHATHHGFFHEHLVVKGTELASACRATLAALRKLDALVD